MYDGIVFEIKKEIPIDEAKQDPAQAIATETEQVRRGAQTGPRFLAWLWVARRRPGNLWPAVCDLHGSSRDSHGLLAAEFSTKEPKQMGSRFVGGGEFAGNTNRHTERFHEWGEAVFELLAAHSDLFR